MSINTSTAIPSRRVVALGVVIALAALVIRLWAIGVPDLTEDEELSTALPLVTYGELFSNIGDRPPLPFLAQKIAVSLTGSATAETLRIPSAVEGALTVLVLFLLAYRLGGSTIAIISALLLCLSHFHFVWSRDARYYPMLSLTALLFIWCYWEGVRGPRLRYLVLAIPAAVALSWSHYVGNLVIAACALTFPVFLFTPPWRAWIKQHRTQAVIALIAVLLGAAVALLAMGTVRLQLQRVLSVLRTETPRTENFDIAPLFLLHRAADLLRLPVSVFWFAGPILILGVLMGAMRRRAFTLIGVAVIAVPFALVWVLRPPLVFHPKYFIFMLPLLDIALAAGIAALGVSAARLARRRGPSFERLLRLVPQGLLVALCLAPNVWAIGLDYRYPQTDLQRAGKLLSAWAYSGENLGYTFTSYWRLFSHYLRPDLKLNAAYIEPDEPIRWNVNNVPHTWFLHLGKSHTSNEVAGFLLSDRFSRIAFHQAFLIHGPNVQGIQFGRSHPGWPKADGPLQLTPGGAAQLDILFPRAGRRAVFVHQTAEDAPAVALNTAFPDMPPITLTPIGGGAYLGIGDVPFGRVPVTITNTTTDHFALLKGMEFLPILGAGPLELPCWDFYAMDGGLPATVWSEHEYGRFLLRDLRDDPVLYYRFFCEQPCRAVIRLTALSDPPLPNRYAVQIPGVTGAERLELAFSDENGETSTQSTRPVAFERGVYTIALQYLDLSRDQKAALTNGFMVQAPERIQSSGIEEIAVAPVE